MGTTILQSHNLLEKVSPETVSQHAFSSVAQHRLRLCGRSQHSLGFFRHVSLGNIGLTNLAFGSEVVVEGDAPLDHYYIIRVKTGHMILESEGSSVTIDSKSIAVINPFHSLNLYHSEDCSKLIVRIPRSAIERELTNIIGNPVREPIKFLKSMSLDDPHINSLIRVIDHACQEVDDPFSRYRTMHFSDRIEGLLSSAMLVGLTHDYSSEISQLSEHNVPSYLRRAERYVESHLSDAITLDDLVKASGASMRTLYKAFDTYHNATPIGYVKRIRLDHARKELTNANGSFRTVAEVAMAVGMEHLGNFAADYKRFYRELPSETLRHRC